MHHHHRRIDNVDVVFDVDNDNPRFVILNQQEIVTISNNNNNSNNKQSNKSNKKIQIYTTRTTTLPVKVVTTNTTIVTVIVAVTVSIDVVNAIVNRDRSYVRVTFTTIAADKVKREQSRAKSFIVVVVVVAIVLLVVVFVVAAIAYNWLLALLLYISFLSKSMLSLSPLST
ncbi:PREDICTED: uncharacterized protein LOC108378962 [Rhagoletis zephyria]|uniref:uncharacterized protein LOC108378962 n=1 Tax=Rhagoletis zephyria TaxID=28612 RepID=UPI0008119F1C|nr:PREDICTED: uncharacterized protein LOC108378962 [Rhagoletis zephyria]XP_017490761.1 PREDICTED: uncharacterized protein LOC108378962 [Rhagoletis zephyria]